MFLTALASFLGQLQAGICPVSSEKLLPVSLNCGCELLPINRYMRHFSAILICSIERNVLWSGYGCHSRAVLRIELSNPAATLWTQKNGEVCFWGIGYLGLTNCCYEVVKEYWAGGYYGWIRYYPGAYNWYYTGETTQYNYFSYVSQICISHSSPEC